MNNVEIVGNGTISKIFINISEFKNKCVIYAKGCSNSQNKVIEEFKRDYNDLNNYLLKLRENNNKPIFVYFSTYSISDSSRNTNPYVVHKYNLENLIKQKYDKYIILRIPEIIAYPKRNNNILNFIYYNLKEKKRIDIWSGQLRNLISLDNLAKITKELVNNYKCKTHSYFINKSFIEIDEIIHLFNDILVIDERFINKLYFKKNEFNMTDIDKIEVMINNDETKKQIKEYYG